MAFLETTALGMRYKEVERHTLNRGNICIPSQGIYPSHMEGNKQILESMEEDMLVSWIEFFLTTWEGLTWYVYAVVFGKYKFFV